MKTKKIAVVTGANTGLGFALVKGLCTQFCEDVIVYLTARDETRGTEAVTRLKKMGLNPQFHLLDVTSDANSSAFAKYISNEYGGIDILIHNAAARISPDLLPRNQVENFINTNNLGTTRIIKTFRSLLNDNSKCVIIASGFGSLNNLNKTLHHKFDVKNMNLEDVDAVMNEYVHLTKKGNEVENGWPEWMNIPSKIGQVASMKIFAREMDEQGAKKRNIFIAAACPGLMDTDASRPWFKDMSQAKQPDDAATDLLWIVSQHERNEKQYGQLIQYRKIISWNNEI